MNSKPNFDTKLISQFRNVVTENHYVLFKYENVNGKCLWNCICSAMDWITVAMEYVQAVKKGTVTFQHCMEKYAYISAIDNVWEAVKQLHRVFIDPNPKNKPFIGTNHIFKDKAIPSNDDNTYFKEIRSVFGAHPVNLNNDKHEHYFASWPTDQNIGKGDYSVLLYDSDYEKDTLKTFHIFYSEIDAFLLERYGYLNVIAENIQKERQQYFDEMRNIPIPKSDDIIDQLEVLRKASSKRLNIPDINGFLNELKMIYTVKISQKANREMVEKYRNDLRQEVEQIHIYLQNMDFENDLPCTILLESGFDISSSFGYYCGKLQNLLSTPELRRDDEEEEFVIHGLKSLCEGQFLFKFASIEELAILIRAYIHLKIHEKMKLVKGK